MTAFRLAEDMLQSNIIPAKDFVYYGGSHEFKIPRLHNKGDLDEIRNKKHSLLRSKKKKVNSGT